MTTVATARRAARRLLALAATALVLLAAHLSLVPATAHRFASAPTAGTPALGLAGYVADIEARPLPGLRTNASGLSFNRATGTLFVAINRPPGIAEFSTEGALLRHLPLPDAVDPEGITHVEGDLFVVSDESDNRLHWVRIRPGDNAVRPVGSTLLPADFGALHNLGLEGVSWDERRGELLAVNEKWPRRVLAISGISPRAPGQARISVREWRPQGWPGLVGSDLSSLTVHDASGNLLLLSDESALVAEYSRQGRLLGVLSLAPGQHGLTRDVPQAEGIALGPDGSLYIVSEPNLFYRFKRRR